MRIRKNKKKADEEKEILPEVQDEEIKTEPDAIIEEPLREATIQTDIHIGNDVIVKSLRDYNGRILDLDMFDSYKVYAITGDKVQLRKQNLIIYTKISNIEKI